METPKKLYPSFLNPLLIQTDRPLPREVAVIGAGTIGPDIGYYLKSAMPGVRLHLVDIAEAPLQNAQKRISDYTRKAVENQKINEQAAASVLENIQYTTDYGQIKDCDLIIEAATENIPLKRKIFETVEGIVREDALITSNTSSIPADRLFTHLKRPERTTVTHFFAPAWRSLPVEVISWRGASPETLEYLLWFFAKTGKAPMVTGDAICFMLDRIFDNWCNEAAMVLDTATAAQVDRVAEEFVYAGPFFVLNMANGNPIIIETNTLQMEEGEHYRPASVLASVERWLTSRPGSPTEVPEAARAAVRDRLLAILFSQSFDIVDRGIGTPEDLNFGCQIALGFRTGPMDVMGRMGDGEVGRIMERFSRERPGFPMAGRPIAKYQKFRRHVLVDEINGVNIITIRRPQAMNALNDEITGEILSVLEKNAERPEIEGFVVTGYGNTAFSAGADIGKFPEMLGDQEASAQYARDCAKLQRFMDRMEKPVVAAINGMALGGGFEVAIRCHALVATKNAVFQFPEVTLGILPGIGGCIVPYRKWPKAAEVFHAMIMAGNRLTAAEAADLGIVSRLADDYREMVDAAIGLVNELKGQIPRIPEEPVVIPEPAVPENPASGPLSLSREVVSIIAETIRQGASAQGLEEALEIGYRGFAQTACTQAAREGISAFLEKRKPRFEK